MQQHNHNRQGDITASLSITRIETDKAVYMPLLLIGDESEPMIGRYLDRGELYVGFIGDEAVAVCITTEETDGLLEIKNLAVRPDYQKLGIGRRMLGHVESLNKGRTVILGTGETPSTLRFYKSCGYEYSHRITGFFSRNYPSPIIEEGVILDDMVYLKKST